MKLVTRLFILSGLFLNLSVSYADSPPSKTLSQVENKKVCMVNDMYFAKEQIPVSVNDRTYYGCCENCKKTLKEDAQSRQATDPITGKTVDKSTAVIGADTKGQVHYFENVANLNSFNQRIK